MADIGKEKKEIEFEPIPTEAPAIEPPAPVPAVPVPDREPEKVS